MSSVLLYLAIVVMWLCVLVPMWLRRDRSNLADEYSYSADDTSPDLGALTTSASEPPGPAVSFEPEPEPEFDAEAEAEPEAENVVEPVADRPVLDRRQRRARRRAIIVARRRRLLFFCVLLVLASVVTAAVSVIPWWGVAPAGLLLVAHLSVLRIATSVDQERRQHAAQARVERARIARVRQQRAAELAATQAEAEIIEFTARQADVLFDQYAEPARRAVGD